MDESGRPEPEWAVQLRGNAQALTEKLAHAVHILTAQAAMGWLLYADLDKARESLSRLPPDVLLQVSVAASVLSALADECATEAAPAA